MEQRQVLTDISHAESVILGRLVEYQRGQVVHHTIAQVPNLSKEPVKVLLTVIPFSSIQTPPASLELAARAAVLLTVIPFSSIQT